MEVMLLWLLSGLTAGFIASNKGSSFVLWFALGILLGPFGVVFSLFAGGKRCPKCMSKIHKDATRCPQCRAVLAE